jgi:hypothetical protein
MFKKLSSTDRPRRAFSKGSGLRGDSCASELGVTPHHGDRQTGFTTEEDRDTRGEGRVPVWIQETQMILLGRSRDASASVGGAFDVPRCPANLRRQPIGAQRADHPRRLLTLRGSDVKWRCQVTAKRRLLRRGPDHACMLGRQHDGSFWRHIRSLELPASQEWLTAQGVHFERDTDPCDQHRCHDTQAQRRNANHSMPRVLEPHNKVQR